MDEEKRCTVYNGIIFSHEKGDPAICIYMNDLGGIMLSEISQRKPIISHLHVASKKAKFIETEGKGYQGREGGGNGEMEVKVFKHLVVIRLSSGNPVYNVVTVVKSVVLCT